MSGVIVVLMHSRIEWYAEVSQLMMEARDVTKLRRAFENARVIEQNIFNALVVEGSLPAEYYDEAGKVIEPKNLSEAYTPCLVMAIKAPDPWD